VTRNPTTRADSIPYASFCDLLQVGAVDHWECQLEMEETYGGFRRVSAPVSMMQVGQRIDCAEFENFGRIRLHVRWSVPQLVTVSAALVPSHRRD
jgi:hypothetical protein